MQSDHCSWNKHVSACLRNFGADRIEVTAQSALRATELAWLQKASKTICWGDKIGRGMVLSTQPALQDVVMLQCTLIRYFGSLLNICRGRMLSSHPSTTRYCNAPALQHRLLWQSGLNKRRCVQIGPFLLLRSPGARFARPAGQQTAWTR